MPDPFIELLKQAAQALNRAQEVARQQRNQKRVAVARDYARIIARFTTEAEKWDTPTRPGADQGAHLPEDWAGQIRPRLLNRPDRTLSVQRAAQILAVWPQTIIAAAEDHPEFEVTSAGRKGIGIRLVETATDEAAQ